MNLPPFVYFIKKCIYYVYTKHTKGGKIFIEEK